MAVNMDMAVDFIQRAIDDDPMIRETNIGVTMRKHGLFGKSEIVLFGNVSSENAKKRIQQIAEGHAGALKIVDDLVVR